MHRRSLVTAAAAVAFTAGCGSSNPAPFAAASPAATTTEPTATAAPSEIANSAAPTKAVTPMSSTSPAATQPLSPPTPATTTASSPLGKPTQSENPTPPRTSSSGFAVAPAPAGLRLHASLSSGSLRAGSTAKGTLTVENVSSKPVRLQEVGCGHDWGLYRRGAYSGGREPMGCTTDVREVTYAPGERRQFAYVIDTLGPVDLEGRREPLPAGQYAATAGLEVVVEGTRRYLAAPASPVTITR